MNRRECEQKGEEYMKPEVKSYLFIFTAAALWGGIGFFLDILTSAGLNAMQSVTIRVLLSAVVFTVFLLIKDRSAFRIKLRHIPYFIGTGLFSLVFFNVCYFMAIELSALSIAAVLLYTSPIFVTLMSAALFKEKLTPNKILALCMTFAGCAFVTGVFQSGGGKVPLLAVLLGLLSGFGYALYSIIGKFALEKYSPYTVTEYTFVFAAVGILPFSGLHKAADVLFTGDVILGGLGVSVLCCVLPFLLYTIGLNGVEPGRAAIIATVEPVVASLIGITVLGEEFTWAKLIGIALVVLAIVILNVKNRENEVDIISEVHDVKKGIIIDIKKFQK